MTCPCSYKASSESDHDHRLGDGLASGDHNDLAETVVTLELDRRYSPGSASGDDSEDPDPFIPHTVAHILGTCPLTTHLHYDILHDSSLDFIFGTEAGGAMLCTFLHQSQLLLHPLPLCLTHLEVALGWQSPAVPILNPFLSYMITLELSPSI